MRLRLLLAALLVLGTASSCALWDALVGSAENTRDATAEWKRAAGAIAETSETVNDAVAYLVPTAALCAGLWLREWRKRLAEQSKAKAAQERVCELEGRL